MPCLDYLARVREAHAEIAALGVAVIAVGAGSPAQANVRAFRHGARQGARTGDWRQQSGVALFDADGCLIWLHRAFTLGDYPALPGVLGLLQHAALARRAGPV